MCKGISLKKLENTHGINEDIFLMESLSLGNHIFSSDYVEEINPLLSDVVKFGDILTDNNIKHTFIYAGKNSYNKLPLVYIKETGLTECYPIEKFNNQFKLKK